MSELLLTHPVWNAVYHLVAPSVLGDLALGIVVEQFYKMDIIVPHKGYHVAVGREERRLLRPSVRQWHHPVVLHLEYIVHRRKRTTVYVLGLCLDKYAVTLWTDDISVYRFKFFPAYGVHVKQRPHLFSGPERVLNNLFPVAAQPRICLSVVERFHAGDMPAAEFAAGNALQIEPVAGKNVNGSRE